MSSSARPRNRALYLAMIDSGFTERELAKQVGCAAVTISRLIRSRQDPSAGIAKRLSEVLGFSYKELGLNPFVRGDGQ